MGLTLSTVARALVRRRSGGKAWVMVQKGNGNSSPHLKNEIELATPKSERRELRESELLDVKKAGIRDEFRARPTAALARNDNDAGAKKKHEGFQH